MSKNDLLSLLEKDHKEAKALLQEIIAHCEQQKKVMPAKVAKIKAALTLHTKIEETYLYPRSEKEREAARLVQDACEEHAEIKDLLKKLKEDDEPDEVAKYTKELLICVEHHVKEEEQELFPLLRRLWEQETLLELGDKMLEMKDQELAGR